MRIPLWARLFLTFAALSVVGLLALTLLQKRSFQRDFLLYVNQQATARAQAAATAMGKRYDEVGNWSFVNARPRTFASFFDGGQSTLTVDAAEDERERRPPPGRGTMGRGSNGQPPPPRGDGDPDRPPPPAIAGAEVPPRFDERSQPPPPPPPREGRRPPQQRIDALNIQTRVVLLDGAGRPIVGNAAVPMDSPRIPIIVNGILVGQLLIASQPALESDIDVAFAQSQSQHAFIAALGVLVAALLAALVLARWLLAPVKTLGQRMQQLAAGDYRERIATTRTDELGELALNFNRLAETLVRNQEARRSWGADMAHELRTPIAILRGEIQLMQDDLRPMNKAAMDSLQAECTRLMALVEDLYQLALSDAGALSYRFEICDLNTMVNDAMHDLGRNLQAAGLDTETALSATALPVRIDAQRLTQLFTNVFTNSQRYTDVPGKIKLTTLKEGDTAIIYIDDSAPGVPTAALPKLFDRLFRVESSRNRADGGAGLGLAICKNIAVAHGGAITASSSPLGGLRITLTLPIVRGHKTIPMLSDTS
jgi:two-component system, OmpR family, sensor histidine kinase BaeS